MSVQALHDLVEDNTIAQAIERRRLLRKALKHGQLGGSTRRSRRCRVSSPVPVRGLRGGSGVPYPFNDGRLEVVRHAYRLAPGYVPPAFPEQVLRGWVVNAVVTHHSTHRLI